ncbi:MAG TPA: ABC transporter permease [Gemmatimonadaceae bacterium]|nr:ABC transporter permease [Gemmatimonadaceae bacterium]
MTRLELSIAWRYLRSRSASRLLNFISVISIIGVLVGVSALIVIISVMNGLQNDLREKILVASPDIRVLTFGDALVMSDWRSVLSDVKGQPGVAAAAPFVLTQGLATVRGDYVEGAMIVGIEPASPNAAQVTGIRGTARAGQDFSFATTSGELHGIAVGKRLAERLNVFPGDSLTLISAAGAQLNAVTGTPVPRYYRYEVTAWFETGMYEYDNAYLYMPIGDAQTFAALGDAVTGIEARAANRFEADAVADALRASLVSYRVVDWQEQNSGLYQALKLEKLVMGVILLLIVIVAAFNIVSSLTMVVRDKTREIGILKAMGMPARSIRRIFLAQGTVIGMVGTLIGAVLGLGTAIVIDRYKLITLDASVYLIDHLPIQIEFWDVLWIILASILIAVLATMYPSLQAARLYPVEAIRDE